jgi:hypothetical protein
VEEPGVNLDVTEKGPPMKSSIIKKPIEAEVAADA